MSVANQSYIALNPPDETSPTESVRVLAISPFSQDHLTLQSIISHSKWVLRTTSTYAEALEILSQDVMPVIITERDLGPYSWKDVLQKLASITNPPRLIVAADHADADARLWGEVLNFGAYDVLSKPFRSAELFLSVSSAWRAWKYSEAMRLPDYNNNCEHAAVPSSESLVSMPPNRKTAGREVHIQQQLPAICG
jgi:DNA-binding NtrC family response regulator